jgi:SAM-dependent methyltransferase
MRSDLSIIPVADPVPTPNPGEVLRRFLQAYWLRPENALWMTLRSQALGSATWRRPVADLCCGDGVFSFLHCGGDFDPDFDVFQSVSHLDRVLREHADMFDHVSEDYRPTINRRPRDMIDLGTDHKSTLLAKAQHLGLYARLRAHDHNEPLSERDESFETVYCNAAYWVAQIESFLSELHRIVRPSGRVILHVKLDAIRRFTFDAHERLLGARFLDILGRGRLDCWPSLTDRFGWERRFGQAGFTIESATPFATRTHAHLWDIGLRPLAPLLVRITSLLTPSDRSAVKAEWVELMCDLLTPLANPELDLFGGEEEPAEIQYILQRR